MKLADVLWEAANKWLPIEEFSCHSVAAATFGKHWRSRAWHHAPALTFLSDLGCDRGRCATSQEGWRWLNGVDGCRATAESTRYMWLLLAMHVAEDEGIEVQP